MTPARTLTLALICARAFAYDLTNKNEHNCTISKEGNRICNTTKYGDNVDVKIDEANGILKSNESKDKNDLGVIYIEDDHSELYHVFVSRKSDEIDNNSTNVNHNRTNNRDRYFYDHQKLDGNVFDYNDDLQAYLAVSEHNIKGNVRKAFDETLFSDVSQDDVIYELSGMYLC